MTKYSLLLVVQLCEILPAFACRAALGEFGFGARRNLAGKCHTLSLHAITSSRLTKELGVANPGIRRFGDFGNCVIERGDFKLTGGT
jgi:hypothetical protein